MGLQEVVDRVRVVYRIQLELRPFDAELEESKNSMRWASNK